MSKIERFQEIYEKYHKLVWHYVINNIKGDKCDHEDVFQQVWMGVWSSIEKIQPGKEHAFLYKVIMNQIYKFYYYNTKYRKAQRIELEESSEGDSFNLSDLCNEIARSDDYEYFEILDAIESVLTEEEFDIFLHYLQGFSRKELVKQLNIKRNALYRKIESIKTKLSDLFEQEATLPYFITKKKK